MNFPGFTQKCRLGIPEKEALRLLKPCLFPHTRLSDIQVHKALDLFEGLAICQPWFMPPPRFQEASSSRVTVLHPPADLKPPEDLNALLTEYKSWIRQNLDRGYTAFLKTFQAPANAEDAPWNIMHAIRRGRAKEDVSPSHERTLRWHLMLHLAGELEENLSDAEILLHKIKQSKSPLHEALGEGAPPHSVLDDLPPNDPSPYGERYLLEGVLEAWLGLFSGHLSENRLLLTFDREIFQYVSERFSGDVQGTEPEGPTELQGEEVFLKSSSRGLIRFSSPPTHAVEPPFKGNLSGRALVWL